MNELNYEVMENVDEFLQNENSVIKDSLLSLIKDYKKKSKRLDRIIKQSDKQQFSLMQLNTMITNQREELDKLHQYDTQQQIIAREKLDSAIVDDLKDVDCFSSKIIYRPADILSGDFYSTHILSDGSVFAYIIDGQGHGISPALTVFAVSSTISHLVEENIVFKDIVEKLFPIIQKFLGEIEQLSFTMIGIDSDEVNMHYVSGGMYPFMIKHGDSISTYKVNNLPFMNFSPTPKISTIALKNWNEIIIYTDGLVEDLSEDMSDCSPINIFSSSELFTEAKQKIENGKFEDDITVVQITNVK